jgi:hypothetical protein
MGGARHSWAHEPLNELYSGRVLSVEHLLNKEEGEDEIYRRSFEKVFTKRLSSSFFAFFFTLFLCFLSIKVRLLYIEDRNIFTKDAKLVKHTEK